MHTYLLTYLFKYSHFGKSVQSVSNLILRCSNSQYLQFTFGELILTLSGTAIVMFD